MQLENKYWNKVVTVDELDFEHFLILAQHVCLEKRDWNNYFLVTIHTRLGNPRRINTA